MSDLRRELDAILARIPPPAPALPIPPIDLALVEPGEALRRVWHSFAAQIGIPLRLRDASMADASTPALTRARQYVERDYEQGRCLVLTGPTGVGKSWAAAAVLRAVSHTAVAPASRRFWYFPALCGGLLDPERRAEMLGQAKQCPCAVLDDLGTEYVKEGGLLDAFLDEIIWHREANALATVITTNLTTDGLRQRLSARLIDRLRGEWGVIYECPGESRR